MKFKTMNRDEIKDWIETILGGVFGVVAIIAAIFEYKLGDNGAVAGLIKDVFSTAVVVVLLFAAVPPRKPKKMDKILEEKIEKWGMDNAPLIFKVENFVCAKEQQYTQGFSLLQNPTKYISLLDLKQGNPEWHTFADYHSKQTGKFLDLPSYKDMVSKEFNISFVLEQKHFKEKESISTIINDLVDSTNNRFEKSGIEAKRLGNSGKFTVSFSSPIKNKKDIEFFISVIDFVLSLVKVIV